MLMLERRLKLRETGVASSMPVPNVVALKPIARDRKGRIEDGSFITSGVRTGMTKPPAPDGSAVDGVEPVASAKSLAVGCTRLSCKGTPDVSMMSGCCCTAETFDKLLAGE